MPGNKKKGIGFFDLMLGAPFPQGRYEERQAPAAQPQYYYPSPQQQEQSVYTHTIPGNDTNSPPQKQKKVRFADNLVRYSDEEPEGDASTTAAQVSEPDSSGNLSITIKRSSGGKYTMNKGNAQMKAKAKGKGKSGQKEKGKAKKGGSRAEKKRRIKKALEYLIASDSEASFSSDDDESTSESEQEDGEAARNDAGKKARAAQPAVVEEEKEPADPVNGYDHEEQRAYSRNYFHRHVLREQYPDRLKITPDRAFSADDCAILANLEARQHALRYHHLQADFCNATGRMLPLDFIKAKVESARPRLSS